MIDLSVHLVYETGFVFFVKDEGSGFDFNNIPDPTDPENLEKEHGRGVFLINKLLTRTLILHYALHQPKQPRLPGSGNHHGQTPLP